MTYLGDRKLGNFKPPKSKRLEAKRQKPAKKRAARLGNSDDHLAALRKCPCCITLQMPAGEVHHLKFGTNERGTGMKSSDRWGVPLSRKPHDEVERVGTHNEPRWFADHGIESPLDLAAALWNASPDVAAMTKIILAHRGRH